MEQKEMKQFAVLYWHPYMDGDVRVFGTYDDVDDAEEDRDNCVRMNDGCEAYVYEMA